MLVERMALFRNGGFSPPFSRRHGAVLWRGKLAATFGKFRIFRYHPCRRNRFDSRGEHRMHPITIRARVTTALCIVTFMLSALGLRAEVRLPSLLSDGMVLQQGMKVNIWGTADPGEQVTVTFENQQTSGVAGAGGEWAVKLGPLTAGGPFTMTIAGKNTITLHDVLVGEVWVCSGQSNMEMPVTYNPPWSAGVTNYQDEIARADHPRLRMFTVEKAVAARPQPDVKGFWVAAHPLTVGQWSAVGYFFGRNLLDTLNVPVGLIHSSWGGTPAESWTSRATLESEPEFRSILEAGTKLLGPYPKVFQDFAQQLAQWRQDSDRAEAAGAPVPTAPTAPDDPRRNPWRPSGLFNAMIMPLTPYAIRGAIWYQGESNADRPAQYRKLFPAMIGDWRRAWEEGDFPFLFVQLANWGIYSPHSNWPELREAQLKTLSVPRTGMAVTIDIGDGSDIHPRDKQDVGHRLALAAQAIAYGRDVIYSGPIYESMTVEGEKIRLHFKYDYAGLMVKNIYTPELRGFEIAGADRNFVSGEAKIEGATVVVRSAAVPHPVAVRYGWGMNPWCNLYNRAGLPASPFRTDDWEDASPEKQDP
jgi:sialate O-acetylesterase